MLSFPQDFRYAFRQLRNSPGFSLTAILTLTLGIGATTAIFSIVNGVLLRPLPFFHPDQLVALHENLRGIGDFALVPARDVQDYTRDNQVFTSVGGFRLDQMELSGSGEPLEINATRATAGTFPALDVAPLLGRVFTKEEDERGEELTVLSYDFWRDRFHGDPHVLETKVLLDRKPYLVIGVMPRSFEFPLKPGHLNSTQVWIPMSFTTDELTRGAASFQFGLIARLKSGITLAQAETDVNRITREINNGRNFTVTAVLHPLTEDTIASARPLVRVLFVAALVVLLIACANLAGLLLLRAIRNQHEFGIRLALGARGLTLLRQSIAESLVLSFSGGALGVLMASIALFISKSRLPETLPRIQQIGLNWTVVGFAILLAVVTGVFCATAPALAAMRTNMNDTLKEGGRTGTSGGGYARLRSAMVIGEVAVALILLTAAGLLLRSFEKMREMDPGFRSDQTAVARYALPEQNYPLQASVDTFNKELLRRLEQLPGTQAAGLGMSVPASSTVIPIAMVPEGFIPAPHGAPAVHDDFNLVQGEYFRALGIPLLHGRFFSDADTADGQLVAIASHKLAQHYWPGQDPIGKRLRIYTGDEQSPWLTIVGEVADVTPGAIDGPTNEQFYQPVDQESAALGALSKATDVWGRRMFLVLRTSLPPDQTLNAVRAIAHSLDPQLALTQLQTMDHAVSQIEAPRRFNTVVIATFAAIAVLLAVIGVYSVIASAVAMRTQEMAIRMAVGAQRGDVSWLVLRSGLTLGILGCAIGSAGAGFTTHLLGSLLFHVKAIDPIVYGMACAGMLLLTVIASYLPARRAAAVDPIQALRAE